MKMWWKWILLFICCFHNTMQLVIEEQNDVHESSLRSFLESSPSLEASPITDQELISKKTQSSLSSLTMESIDQEKEKQNHRAETTKSILEDIIEETMEKTIEIEKSSASNQSEPKSQNDPEIKEIVKEFLETTLKAKTTKLRAAEKLHTTFEHHSESSSSKSHMKTSENINVPGKPETPALGNEVKELPIQEENADHWSLVSSLPTNTDVPQTVHPPPATFRTLDAKMSVGIGPNASEAFSELRESNTTDVESETTKQELNLIPPSDLKPSSVDSKESGSTATDSENMPSFKEWTEKRLAEQEKNGGNGPSTASAQGKSSSGLKIRQKNYASSDCGAKIIGTNSEAQGSSAVLNSFHDEYMLNPCTAKIWLVIELCEPIQASKIEIANFELFSSSPKDFTVYSSDRYPSRDWMMLGSFEAKDEKTVQSFTLEQRAFHKFLKLELSSHYGSEHYCPVSLIHIYGTSELEVLDTDGDGEADTFNNHDQDDESLQGGTDAQTQNLFGSAKDAVLSIVKKAAEALSRDKQIAADQTPNVTDSEFQSSIETDSLPGTCITLIRPCFKGHYDLFGSDDSSIAEVVEHHLSCNFVSLHKFLHLSLIQNILAKCNCGLENYTQSNSCSLYESQVSCRYLRMMLGSVRFAALGFLYRLENKLVDVVPPNSKTYMNCTQTNVAMDTDLSPENTIISTVIPIEPALDNSLGSVTGTLSSTDFLDESSLFNLSEINESHSGSILDSSSEIPVSLSLKDQIHPTKTLKPEKIVEKNSSSSPESQKLDRSEKSKHQTEEIVSEKDVTPEDTRATSDAVTPSSEMSLESSLVLTEETSASPLKEELIHQSQIVDSVSLPVDKSPSLHVTSCSTDHTLGSDSLFMDLSESGVPPVSQESASSSSTSGSTGNNKTNLPPAVQKESIFVRLSNRIKSLEQNMSLSGQYLEELSQRYRKQMEEMQKAFNKTIAALNDTAAKAYQQDLKQQESINTLHMQIDELKSIVASLQNEKENLSLEVIERHAFLIFIELLIGIVVFLIYKRKSAPPFEYLQKTKDNSATVNFASVDSIVDPMCSKRRNSFAGPSGYGATLTKDKRTASDETLNKSGTYSDLMIVEPVIPIMMEQPAPKNESKKKKQKHKKAARDLKCSSSSQNLAVNNHQHHLPPLPPEQYKHSATAGKKNSLSKVTSAELLFSSKGNESSNSHTSDTFPYVVASKHADRHAKNLHSAAAVTNVREGSKPSEVNSNTLISKQFAQASLMKRRNGHVCNGDVQHTTETESSARTLFQKLFYK